MITLGPSPEGAFLTYIGAYRLIRLKEQKRQYEDAYEFAIACFPELPAWAIWCLVNGKASEAFGVITLDKKSYDKR